jgi:predicted transcriptional regulator
MKTKERKNMKSLNNEALAAISSLPDDTSVDEIMYRLYVIDKVRKGQEASETGKTITAEELEKEISSW